MRRREFLEMGGGAFAALVPSVHGRFYNQGAALCLRFIANYFRDGYGHLGDVNVW